MESRRKNWVTGHVLTPVVERDSPGIGAAVSPKTGQTMGSWPEPKPATVLLTDRTVGRLNLGMMKDPLSKEQVSIGSPGEIVQCVMRILGAKSTQQDSSHVGTTITIGVLQEGQVGHFRNVDSTVSEFE